MQASEMALEQCCEYLGIQHCGVAGCDDCTPTLDAAAAAMPEGWYIKIDHWRYDSRWHADAFKYDAPKDSEGSNERVIRLIADTELLARFRLAVACRQAQGATHAKPE